MSDTGITIQLNGEPAAMPDNTSISAMLRLRKINPDEVVVELNREIVDKASFETRTLQAADIVEVLRFVGGG